MKAKRGIRIIVGGPPNSGKSTFAVSLAMALCSIGVNAIAKDLDLASETVKFITGEESWENRSKVKKEWTIDLAKGAAKQFLEASSKYDVVIGDAPGKIDMITWTISQEASHGSICCRDDCKNEIQEWKKLFKSLGKEVIVTVTSKLSGVESISVDGLIEATLIGLNRKPRVDGNMRVIAWHIKRKLNV